MDFTSIPDCNFLEIFRHLPFKDRVRVGRVSVAFRRMSKIAISETKCLKLLNWKFEERITPTTVSNLLNLCANRLEEVTFDAVHHQERDMLAAFAEYRCPNLKKITSGVGEKDILNVLLRNYPQLKNLVIKGYIKYPDVVSEELETLHCSCDDECFESLMNRVPNLKHLELDAWFESPRVMDRFLSTVPNLETFHLDTSGPIGLHLEKERMSSFWQLKSLTSLHINDGQDGVADEDLTQIGDCALTNIAKSFPRMRDLSLIVTTITDRGVAALSSLRDLQFLCLECKNSGRRIDDGVRELAKCERLQKLRVGLTGVLSPETFTTLLHSCTQLNSIAFYDLAKVGTCAKAASIVASLSGLGPRVIEVKFDTYGKGSRLRWESPTVKRALKKLEEGDGVVLKFGWPFNREFDAVGDSSHSEMESSSSS